MALNIQFLGLVRSPGFEPGIASLEGFHMHNFIEMCFCVLNQLDDDRHSDTVVLETQKAIDSTLTMLTNDGQKPNTVRHTKYKLLELAAHVDLFNPEAVKNYVATAIARAPSSHSQPRQKTSSFMQQTNSTKTKEYNGKSHTTK
jgi:hypothetical protein